MALRFRLSSYKRGPLRFTIHFSMEPRLLGRRYAIAFVGSATTTFHAWGLGVAYLSLLEAPGGAYANTP